MMNSKLLPVTSVLTFLCRSSGIPRYDIYSDAVNIKDRGAYRNDVLAVDLEVKMGRYGVQYQTCIGGLSQHV